MWNWSWCCISRCRRSYYQFQFSHWVSVSAGVVENMITWGSPSTFAESIMMLTWIWISFATNGRCSWWIWLIFLIWSRIGVPNVFMALHSFSLKTFQFWIYITENWGMSFDSWLLVNCGEWYSMYIYFCFFPN